MGANISHSELEMLECEKQIKEGNNKLFFSIHLSSKLCQVRLKCKYGRKRSVKDEERKVY